MTPWAIVPCRLGSKGIPGKNLRLLAGVSPVVRAVRVAQAAGCRVVVSSEATVREQLEWGCNADAYHRRPVELAQDDSPMIDVIRDVIPTIDSELVVLVQCTQPLRQPKHLRAAIDLLESSGADSVVSVVELPPTHHPQAQAMIDPFDGSLYGYSLTYWQYGRRQNLEPSYIRDGTVYAFRRETIARWGTIYGRKSVPLIVPPEETCPLDTPEDWTEAERRLRARQHTPSAVE